MRLDCLRFSGYRDFIQARTHQYVGLNRQPVPVITLKPDSYEGQPKAGGHHRLTFPKDKSQAYFKAQCHGEETLHTVPEKQFHLNEAGAYVLSKMLGLDIVPPTELVVFPSPNKKGKTILGSIQEWQEGDSVDNWQDSDHLWDQLKSALIKDPDQLFEHYLFLTIAYDTDKEDGRNIQVLDNGGQVKFIDNALSGNNPFRYDPDDFKEIHYSSFVHWIEGQILPEKYLNKLDAFIQKQKDYSQELEAYYDKATVESMFNRARLIRDAGKVLSIYDTLALIRQGTVQAGEH